MIIIKNIDYYVTLAKVGTRASIDLIMKTLNKKMTLAQSKFIDYALGHVESKEGVEAMTHYLFHGTKVQRNYCALYFGRKDEYTLIREAYELGLIDGKQAFSR